jgi:hypothetical protein
MYYTDTSESNGANRFRHEYFRINSERTANRKKGRTSTGSFDLFFTKSSMKPSHTLIVCAAERCQSRGVFTLGKPNSPDDIRPEEGLDRPKGDPRVVRLLLEDSAELRRRVALRASMLSVEQAKKVLRLVFATPRELQHGAITTYVHFLAFIDIVPVTS